MCVLHVRVYILCGMCVCVCVCVHTVWFVCVRCVHFSVHEVACMCLGEYREQKMHNYVHSCVRDTHRHSPPGVLCRPLPRRSSAWSATHRSAPTSQTLKGTEAQEEESGGSRTD